MNEANDLDFGPLKGLIGVWTGDEGVDVAPEPDGAENNPYFETITYSALREVTNAESQNLAAVHYRQIVKRKSDGEVFHDESGYWMWDAEAQTVTLSGHSPWRLRACRRHVFGRTRRRWPRHHRRGGKDRR